MVGSREVGTGQDAALGWMGSSRAATTRPSLRLLVGAGSWAGRAALPHFLLVGSQSKYWHHAYPPCLLAVPTFGVLPCLR